MSLELSLISGFVFHFIGDYLLQNDYMAQNKTKSFVPAFISGYGLFGVVFMFFLFKKL
jgi:hypothetical protein